MFFGGVPTAAASEFDKDMIHGGGPSPAEHWQSQWHAPMYIVSSVPPGRMLGLDYESLILWDVILYPAVFAIVLGIFAAAAYFDMRRCRRSDLWKRRYMCAFAFYLTSSVLVVAGLALDLWRTAWALEGIAPNPWLRLLDDVLGCACCLFLPLAVLVTVWCMWLKRGGEMDHRLSHPKDEGHASQPAEGNRDQETN
jgi:hypothetical protein